MCVREYAREMYYSLHAYLRPDVAYYFYCTKTAAVSVWEYKSWYSIQRGTDRRGIESYLGASPRRRAAFPFYFFGLNRRALHPPLELSRRFRPLEFEDVRLGLNVECSLGSAGKI